MRISVCCPSYKRPKVETLEYLPFVRIYVDPAEYDEYVAANEGADIVSCPEGVQGNSSRVRNYILDTEFEAGADVVLLLDDDLKGVYFWQKCERHRVEPEEFLTFVEKYSSVCAEYGAFFWGVNVNMDKQVYMEYTPFSTLSFIGGPFQCFLKDKIRIRYDERLPLKEDYDMTLQQLNIHRKVFRVNNHYYAARQSAQAGGCAMYRNFEREKEQLELLQKKWGSRIVKVDTCDRNHQTKKAKKMDYNPIIHAPIKGV